MAQRLLTLADGVVAELSLDDTPSHLRHLSMPLGADLGAEQRRLLIQLWRGLDPRRIRDPRIAPLVRRGLLAVTTRHDDGVLQHHLDQQCQPWRWSWPGPHARWRRLYRSTLRAFARRKLLVQDFGQTPCLPETTVRRACLCPGDRMRVLCLGDDDLVSLPLALSGHSVVACDIDGQVLVPLLRDLARDGALPLRAVQRDLTRSWPLRERGCFDVVFTDPMSTRNCLRLFLSRAITALRPGGTLISCVHPAALDTFDEVRRELHLELRGHHADFNRYLDENWTVDSYRSDLVVLERTARSVEAVPGNAIFDQDLFAGIAGHRAHAWCVLRGLRPLAEPSLRRALEGVLASGLLPLQGRCILDSKGDLGILGNWPGGGTFTLRARAGQHELAFDVYPFDEARETAILHILQRCLPGVVTRYGHGVLRPHRQILGEAG
ncbi:MAG: bis-aminopropyl spermidine synthase family protein [Pseudomonadota bacterium]